MSTYVRNIQPYAVYSDAGFPRVIRQGDVISTDDPAYKGREYRFETLDQHAEREHERRSGGNVMRRVERTTAAPGERRDVDIPESDAKPKAVPGYACDHEGCDFASTSERGLKVHQRTHDDG